MANKITKDVLISSFGFNQEHSTGAINGISEVTFVFTERFSLTEDVELFKDWIKNGDSLIITVEKKVK